MASGGGNYSSFSILYTKSHVDSVECRVCNEVFSLQGEKVPRLLICGHTVCHQCLSRLPQHSTAIHCPFDRQPTVVGDAGVWGLKKNFALIELLEKLRHAHNKPSFQWSEELLAKERRLAIACDENEEHVAVLYCMTCGTNLCPECSEVTHSTRTLAKHRRVALSDKPKEYPKCQYHPMHLVEFACLEEECQPTPLMCYICKDYGRHLKHKHVLLETEAQNVRSSIVTALQHVKSFGEEVEEITNKMSCVIQQIEGSPSELLQGTSEESRSKVKHYFTELQEKLKRQEMAALTVVDTHIRERLSMLKQQQDDMAVLLSQISAVCYQCEKTLSQDDSAVLLAKQEVAALLSSVHTQQQQLTELPPLDPAIPITFTKDNRVHIGPKMEMRVVTLGLDDSGKTSILFRLKQNEFITMIPTIGFNVETVEFKNLKITIWDVGGQQKLRPLWKHYYFNTQALIYVVDSSKKDRLKESYNELAKLLQEKELKDAALLIFANKQDVTGCASIESISEQFGLLKLCCSRSWHIQGCDACTGAGLSDGLEWLSHQLVASTATI